MSANEFYTNSDGLNLRFGLEKGVAAKMGRHSTMGDKQELVVIIDWTDTSSTDAIVGTHPLAGLPSGVYLESADFYITEAFAGSSGTLDIGLWNDDGDGTFSVSSVDGIDQTIAVTAIDAIDDQIACDGSLIGVTTNGTGSRDLYVSVKGHASNNFTAGTGKLVIVYHYV